jgi:hypothetical protein
VKNITKKTPVSSITELPSDWCDILKKNMAFVATAVTRAKHEHDPGWAKLGAKKSAHIFHARDGWNIVVDEDAITDEILTKYIDELNLYSPKKYTYVSDPNFFQ